MCGGWFSERESKNTYVRTYLVNSLDDAQEKCTPAKAASGSAKEHAKGNKVLLHAAFKANQVTN